MNDLTRKASNALVAAVDFFQGALLAEAQAGEAKQQHLDELVRHLRDVEISRADTSKVLEDADKEVARLRELLEAEQRKTLELCESWKSLRQERDDLKSKLSLFEADRDNLTQTKPLKDRGVLTPNEARNVLNVLERVKALLSFRPRTKSFEKALVLLTRDMKALDDVKFEG